MTNNETVAIDKVKLDYANEAIGYISGELQQLLQAIRNGDLKFSRRLISAIKTNADFVELQLGGQE